MYQFHIVRCGIKSNIRKLVRIAFWQILLVFYSCSLNLPWHSSLMPCHCTLNTHTYNHFFSLSLSVQSLCQIARQFANHLTNNGCKHLTAPINVDRQLWITIEQRQSIVSLWRMRVRAWLMHVALHLLFGSNSKHYKVSIIQWRFALRWKKNTIAHRRYLFGSITCIHVYFHNGSTCAMPFM